MGAVSEECYVWKFCEFLCVSNPRVRDELPANERGAYAILGVVSIAGGCVCRGGLFFDDAVLCTGMAKFARCGKDVVFLSEGCIAVVHRMAADVLGVLSLHVECFCGGDTVCGSAVLSRLVELHDAGLVLAEMEPACA